jgi:hypothetical protein
LLGFGIAPPSLPRRLLCLNPANRELQRNGVPGCGRSQLTVQIVPS